ncbi:YHS domain-containing protein, partial [candidate division KSB1 bacterium]|nr:YHS domain-containing protein [candidate division KSB1 bacterium]
MRKNIWIISVFALLILINISNLSVLADDSKKAETITCPVSGETVLKSEAVGPVNHKGTDFYFCCNSCVEKFKQDPEKFTVNCTCCDGMVMNKKEAKVATYQGKEYYFCNDNCKANFEKDPEGTLKNTDACKKECCANKKAGCCSQ